MDVPRVIPGRLLAGLLLSSLACSGEGSDAPTDIVIRVEGGVTVVENPGFHVADSTSWSIDPEPAFQIGELEGPSEYLFGRIGGFLVLPGGNILVADGQASELRIYDPQGEFLRRVGREGEGPGEFQGISGIELLDGDSLAVLERDGQMIHILDPQFDFVRRFGLRLSEMSAEPPLTSDMLEGIFEDGAPVMGDYIRVCERGSGEPCVDSVRFFRTDETGDIRARFGRHAYARDVSAVTNGTNASWSWPHPQPLWAIAGDALYHIDADQSEIRVYTRDGELERRIRVESPPPSWERDEVYVERELPSDPMMAELVRGVREVQESSPLPDPFPRYSDIAVDGDGWIWALEYLPPAVADVRPPRWFVFDPEGRLRHALPSPPGLIRSWRASSTRPGPRMGREILLGLERDELGVESVVGYRLRRGG